MMPMITPKLGYLGQPQTELAAFRPLLDRQIDAVLAPSESAADGHALFKQETMLAFRELEALSDALRRKTEIEARAEIERFQDRLDSNLDAAVISGLVTVVLATLLALFLADRIVVPIEVIGRSVARIERGEYGDRIDIPRGDELGRLGDNINAMRASIAEGIRRREEAEARLRELNASLESRVANRTKALQAEIENRKSAEAAMFAAKNAAEEANRAKSEFLSSMSHELRTPMNSILGFSQLLAEDPQEPLGPRHQRFVQQVLENGHHLLALIDQVLDLSKIEAGKAPVNFTDVSLGVMVGDCALMMRPVAARLGVSLMVDESVQSAPPCRADERQLRQVLLNLLSNAIKYNRKGGSVTVRAIAGRNGCNRLSVSDTGLGIAPDRQDHLFEPFNRLGFESSNIEGSGIGLTIARQLAELMGGEIGFESVPDLGSTFWVELPRAAA